MKKFVSILSVAAVFAAALLFTGCEKYAYSSSTNRFRNASTYNVLSDKMDINVGQVVSIVAAMDYGKGEYLYGKYSVTTNDAAIVGAQASSFEGKECILLTGVSVGSTNVSLHLLHDGFELRKTITVTVLP